MLDLGDLSGIGATKQGHGPAVLDDGRQKLAVVVVAHLPHVLEASEVCCGLGPWLSLGQGSGLLRAEGGAVLSPRAEERGCVRLGIWVADGAGLAKHVAGRPVRRGGGVVEVSICTSWLSEEPGDMLYVCWGEIIVGLPLCCRCGFGRREET